MVAVDYLAFYQPGAFGNEGGGIQYVAEVRGHELTTRAEPLHEETDHPRSGEEYYKLQIGPLEPLPAPILAEKWRRITFFYTTGEYLLNARTIQELIVQSGEREVLWQALRERASQSQAYGSKDLADLELDQLFLRHCWVSAGWRDNGSLGNAVVGPIFGVCVRRSRTHIPNMEFLHSKSQRPEIIASWV